jgi:DNA-directed RNA polymerase specialized sigma subunit
VFITLPLYIKGRVNMKTPEELFEDNQNLVKNTIYKLLKNPVSIAKNKNLDFEDLMQIGTIGLWMAGLSKFR